MKESAYKNAGVDIEAGAALVERIRPHIAKTGRSGTVGGLGGFGAFFDPAAAGYRDPLLVSSTDGVGTKLKVAIAADCHDTVGIDLVAMCVNDIVVQGAEPLFFLDYFATGRLDNDRAEAVIAGIAQGCAQAGCALIGGETAEMPGMYAAGDYDLAGFSVGAVERGCEVTGATIAQGDIVLGLASSGLHSNGYSLVRRIVETAGGGDYAAPAPFAPEQTVGRALLVPTRIYVRPLLKVLKAGGAPGDRPRIGGLAHITGGGLLENVPRVIPDGLSAVLDVSAWPLPPVFSWLAEAGGLGADDMARTFNCGIGMAVICPESAAESVAAELAEQGETVHRIGHIAAGDGTVRMEGVESAWRLKN